MTAKKRGSKRGKAHSVSTHALRTRSKSKPTVRAGRRSRAATAVPKVLFIDDQADSLERTTGLALREALDASYRDPTDFTAGDLWNADVIMVDFDLAHSGAAASLEISASTNVAAQAPQDGLGLIGKLRRITELNPKGSPAAYVIFTGDAKKLPGHIELEGREHVLAAAYGVEWIFEKTDNHLRERIGALGRAVRGLPRGDQNWQNSAQLPLAVHLLHVPARERWRNEAKEQILSSEPPLDTTVNATQGIALLRWLLHGILPYPTFLLSIRHLAARLRVTPSSLRKVLAGESWLARFLAPARYTGILCDFAGDRWWRAGVESLLWSLSEGDPNPTTLQSALKREEPSLKASIALQPVVALDSALRETDEQVSVDAAVEVRPEGWPSYADPAWLATDLVREYPDLRAVIVARDRDRVVDTL